MGTDSTLELVPGAEISDVTDATSAETFKEFQHRPTGTSGIRYKRPFTLYQHFRMLQNSLISPTEKVNAHVIHRTIQKL